jgi:hypothetical protein
MILRNSKNLMELFFKFHEMSFFEEMKPETGWFLLLPLTPKVIRTDFILGQIE